MSSSQLNVAREDLGEETIAENLGLSPEEVAKWMVRQELDQSEEGVLFGHRIVFADDTPKSILEKAGAEEGELYVIISSGLYA
ncbi:hypothetical protein [Pseudomonas akapageensis]|uniref:hypothetical protein n=1 Tax=Pseudomonas akapageensis TaxID=2609961 RepID=UPI00140922CB|nr:hypothetical protein [Pseudomonas akapageensis]